MNNTNSSNNNTNNLQIKIDGQIDTITLNENDIHNNSTLDNMIE